MPIFATAPAGAIKIQSVVGATDISTTIATYADINALSITVLEPGDYLVFLSMPISIQRNTIGIGYLQILKQATVIGVTQHEAYDAGVQYFGSSGVIITYVTGVAAGDIIKAQWKCNSTSVTMINNASSEASQYFRRLTIMKVA